MRRKRIAVISGENEAIYQNRVINGINIEASKHDCDVLIFTTFIKTADDGEYRTGETNIYNLINYDDLDGIIVLYLPLEQDRLKNTVIPTVKEKAKCPVVCVDNGRKSDDFYSAQVFAEDDIASEEMTDHIIEKHGAKNIYYITGPEGDRGAELRKEGYLRSMRKHSLDTEGKVFHGAFWYDNGENVAQKIINGEIEKPDAICCAADHIAAGCADLLDKNGIKVPDDVLVTGFDGSEIAVFNEICLTSVLPPLERLGAGAFCKLWKSITGEDIANVFASDKPEIKYGGSCKCVCDIDFINDFRKKSEYIGEHNFSTRPRTDISILNNSLMSEKLTSSESIEDCYYKIAQNVYLINDFRFFLLMMCEGWDSVNEYDESTNITHGYTDNVRIVLHSTNVDFLNAHPELRNDKGWCIYDDFDGSLFSSSKLAPDLNGMYDEPLAWYFTPVHFKDRCFGYEVLVTELTQKPFDHIYRNWARNVNNALEMQRIKNIHMNASMRDPATGLFNRRGLGNFLSKHKPVAGEKIFYLAADMNKLKYINDNYGHRAGDEGLLTIAHAARACTEYNEICVRMGGDEFAVVGFGNYTQDDVENHRKKFNEYIEKYNKNSTAPYDISASFGISCIPFENDGDIKKATDEADKLMYEHKAFLKMNRNKAECNHGF